jgi:serine protease inhibitor
MGLPIVSVFGTNVFQNLVAVGAAFGPAGAFISPLSIFIALALALNGASECTRHCYGLGDES